MPKKLTETFEGRSPFRNELDQWMFQQTRGQLQNLYRVFEKHRDYLNNNVLRFVDSNKMDEARMERAKAKDLSAIIFCIKERIKECVKEVNRGGG